MNAGKRGRENLKSLTILRHAKSGWDATVERDFDRPINARGERGAEVVGQWFREQNLPIQQITASPAVRVTQTLDKFAPAAGLADMEPVWDRRIYLASAATLLDVVRETPDSIDHLLIAGHNPGLEDLILMLVPEGSSDPHRAKVDEKLPTCALAHLHLPINNWAELDSEMAEFANFIRPRDLDSSLSPAMDDLD